MGHARQLLKLLVNLQRRPVFVDAHAVQHDLGLGFVGAQRGAPLRRDPVDGVPEKHLQGALFPGRQRQRHELVGVKRDRHPAAVGVGAHNC